MGGPSRGRLIDEKIANVWADEVWSEEEEMEEEEDA
jgi:hypothetical protein